MKTFAFYFISLFSFSTLAQTNASISAGFRSVPPGSNIVASLAHDELLWGEVSPDKPIYGYYRAGIIAGGTPTAAAFFQFAPIAPLVFEIQRGSAYRFSKSPVFDCNQAYCFGVAQRTDVSVKLGAGYKDYIGYLAYLWRDVTLPDSSGPVTAELELMTATPGNHFYRQLDIAWGLKLSGERFVGVLHTEAQFSQNEKRSDSTYILYRWKWNAMDLTAGAGSYNTDEKSVGGSGAVFVITKKFGESLSLF